ncbi:MAG TPA: isocitrate lyase/PEP mutase family protein [Thiolapillus brandeum]|uniref:Isocitrate lyase/PEP mutase family protein n=1 Tax=Thiolapillus brandeum TaxID=1076588 RepID=A0A831NYW8_9GAMM|nr:isocitrate lyase/PEP mutase family protein [Thiolapillus brandeum]
MLGRQLRQQLSAGELITFIGVYDVFSASIAARHFNGIFISGFSFAASHYGLPDIGFITWSDIVAFTQRVRTIVPRHHILVDIDDGYCDPEVASHVVSLLERMGASGVILEDQQRPRQCGHFDGKQIMPLEQYCKKLEKVLDTRRDLLVVARSDATDKGEVMERSIAYAQTGADAILVDGVKDLSLLQELRQATGKPVVFNQIAGGKSPLHSISEMRRAGVSMVNYSTPCLFAAQAAVEKAMIELHANDGLLPESPEDSELQCCAELLNENLYQRDLP